MLCKECYRISYSGENDLNTLHVDAFFLKNDKLISLFKNIWIRVDI